MADKYGNLIDEVTSSTTPQTKPLPATQQYGDLIDEVTTTTPLHNSLFEAAGVNPDEEAKKRKLSVGLGLPVVLLPTNAEEMALLKKNQADELVAKAPATAKFLTNPDNAKITGLDNIESLSAMETRFRTSPRSASSKFKERLSRMEGTGADLNRLERTGVEQVKDKLTNLAGGANTALALGVELTRPINYMLTSLYDAAKIAGRAVVNPDKQQTDLFPTVDKVRRGTDELEGLFTKYTSFWSDKSSQAGKNLEEELQKASAREVPALLINNPGLALDQLMRSVPYMLPGGALAKEGATTLTAYNALIEAGDAALSARQEATKAGMTPEQQDKAALTAAIITAPTVFLANKFLGTGDIEASFFTKGTSGESLLRTFALEALSGGIEEGTNQFSVNVAASAYDPARELGANVAKAAALGSFLEGTHAVGMGAVGAALTAYLGDARRVTQTNTKREDAASKAEDLFEKMSDLSKQAATNPLRARSKEAFAEFADTMAEDAELTEVYVDGKTALEIIQSDAELQQSAPELVASIEEAARTGTDVAITVADYLTHVAGTPSDALMLQSMKTDPEGVTFAQTKDFYEKQQALFTAEATKVEEANQPVMTPEAFAAKRATTETAVEDLGEGQKRFSTPDGATLTVLEGATAAPRENSIIGFEVPEDQRGQGKGGALLRSVLANYDKTTISAAVSSEPSLRAFYAEGFRPLAVPDATIDQALEMMREDSSVTVVSAAEPTLPATYEEYTSQHSNQREVYAKDVAEVEQALLNEFKTAGRFTMPINRAYVAPILAFYETQAKAMGMTPSALYAKYPLRVQSLVNFNPATDVTQIPAATLEDFRSENITSILDKGNWTILTAERPMGEPSPDDQERLAKLEAQLQAEGRTFQKVQGEYGGEETSFIIVGITPGEALEIGRQYQQDSVLTRDGFIYQDGSRTPATGDVTVFKTAPADFYTKITHADGSETFFAVGLDFETRLQPGEVYVNPALIGEPTMAPLAGVPKVEGFYGPDPRIVAVAEKYARDNGIPLTRQAKYVEVDEQLAARIATAYDEMLHTPNDPAVKEAYANLIAQTKAQYEALTAAGYKFWFTDTTRPDNVEYLASPWNAMRDIRANKTMGVFPTEEGFGTTDADISGNPLLADTGIKWPTGSLEGPLKRVTANDLFRAVHDAFGHGLEGAGFRARGEENAWQAHVRLFTGSAVGAITTETRGQNSWLNFGPYGASNQTATTEDTVFADQKTGLMPEWTWTEGRAEDQPQELAQTGDLRQELREGHVSITGYHFSPKKHDILNGAYYGTGIKGAEAERVRQSKDGRIKNRLYFYVDEGRGVFPEYGVGKEKHRVALPNMYDAAKNPLRLPTRDADGNRDMNIFESAVLDAGFDGYYVREGFHRQGSAVLLGDASRNVTPEPENTMNQSVGLRKQTENLKRYGLDPKGRYSTREVAAALEARQREKYGQIDTKDTTPEAKRKIAKWMVEEVLFELETPGENATGWYSTAFQSAIDILAQDGAEELLTDKNARNLLTALVAITSDGQRVDANLAQAFEIYKRFFETDELKATESHLRKSSVDGNLGALTDLFELLGPEEVPPFLLQEKTVKELTAIAKDKGIAFSVSYAPDTKLPMASLIFGPKLGVFYANLMGSEGYLTMDRWWVRTFNRYRGTLLTRPTESSLATFKDLLGKPALSDDEALSIASTYEAQYRAGGYRNKTPLNKLGNTIHRAAFGVVESPLRVSERTFMIDTVTEAKKLLAKKGVDLSIADIQATLWYYEKRLYGQLGAKDTGTVSYADAARNIIALGGDYSVLSKGDPETITDRLQAGNELYQFAGEQALTADQYKLETAKKQLASGKDAEVVRRATGWFKGVDGLWRFEISDDEAKFHTVKKTLEQARKDVEEGVQIRNATPEEQRAFFSGRTVEGQLLIGEYKGFKIHAWDRASLVRSMSLNVALEANGTSKLDDVFDLPNAKREFKYALDAVLDHPKLFAAYPNLRNVSVKFNDNADLYNGYYNHGRREIGIVHGPDEKQLLSTLLHEVQHAIQDEEGFAGGGNISQGFIASVKEGLTRAGGVMADAINNWKDANLQAMLTANEATAMARQALLFKSAQRLRKYAQSDSPSGVFRLIRNEMQWIYDAEFFGTDEAQQLQRDFFSIPNRGDARNAYLADMATRAVDLLESQVTPEVKAKIEADPRSLERVAEALRKEAVRAQAKLNPLRELIKDRKNLDVLSNLYADASPREVYRALAGEVEARNTQARMSMTDEQRRDVSPTQTADTPTDETIVLFGGMDLAAPSLSLAQPVPEGVRGTFNLDTLVISLMKDADLSTVIHESGHFYLRMLQTLANDSTAPQQIVDDYTTALNWFGVSKDEWENMTLEQQRPYHEQWAESFERWTMEGKAPTQELQPIFSRFKDWLLEVYSSLENFIRTHPAAGKLNDEVREVFSRLIASKEAIQATEEARAYFPLFTTGEQAGVSQGVVDDYIALGQQATDKATDELQARSLRDMRWASNARSKAIRDLQNEARSVRAKVKEDVTKEVMAEPINQVREFLRKGVMVDANTGENITALDGYKLDRKTVDEMFPQGALDAPDLTPLRGMTMEEGLDPDVVAGMFGFSSGDALIRTLVSEEKARDKIEGLTDQRMLEEHSDLVDDRAMQRAADEAVHNEARARFVATGLKILSKSPISVTQLNKAAKNAAEATIAKKRVRDVKPNQYQVAETKANRAALAAVAKDPNEAIRQQRNALLNNRLAKAAQEALTEVEKDLRYLGKFNNEGTRKNLDLEYLEQIDALLAPFDLRKGLSLTTIDAQASLADWIAEQEAMGFEPTIDAEAMAEVKGKSYKNLTMEELRGLIDAIKQIEHMGRMKKKLLTAIEKADFAERIAEAKASIAVNANRSVEEKGTPTDVVGLLGQWGRQMVAAHRKFSSYIRELDGGKMNGVMYNLLLRTATKASSRETEMRAQASERIGALFDALPTRIGGVMNLKARKRLIPGTTISLTDEERIMFALNWGNEGNRQRLMDGGITGRKALSLQEAEAVINTLTKEEMDFVQGIFDAIAEYRPMVEELERTLTGKTPEWVEPTPIETRHGTYAGGYFPAKYDVVLSTRSDALEAATDLRSAMKGAFGAASARNGYTKQRADAVVGRPLLLNFNVISRHLNEVIHRLAWQEWLTDANRVVKALDSDLRQTLGAEATKEIQDVLIDIARGEAPSSSPIEVAINRVRTGTSIVGMGWKVTTALLQPSGLTNSFARIGPRFMARGLSRFMANPMLANEWVNANSSLMANRDRTMSREINEILNMVRSDKTTSAITASYFYLIGKFQRMVDVPTYLGAYEKAVEELGLENAVDEAERNRITSAAHDIAGQTVKDVQGSGEMLDLAKAQRGSPAMKLFTNFYSYMNTVYNMNVEAFRTTNFKNPTEVGLFLAEMVAINFVPVVLSVALKNSLKGSCEWSDTECLIGNYKSEQVSHFFGQLLLLREMGVAVDVATGGDAYGYSGPAGLRFFADLYKSGQQAAQGEVDMPLVKSVNNAMGALLHYPAGALNNVFETLVAIDNGEIEGAEIPPALIAGPPR